MTPLLASILAQACEGKGPTARLVADAQGAALREAAIGYAWRRLQATLGIEPAWRFHSLRHFFGTTCLHGGGNVEAVRRLLGHRDLASTTRYVHATERDMVTAVAALPGLGSGNGGETVDRPCP